MMKIINNFIKVFHEAESEWEKNCICCGGCCGAFDDPCQNLKLDENKRYFCEVYLTRLGLRKTVNGKKFHCIHGTNLIFAGWKNHHLCAYKKHNG